MGWEKKTMALAQPYTTPARNLTTRQLSVTRKKEDEKLFAAIKTSRVGASAASAKPRFPQKKHLSLSDLR